MEEFILFAGVYGTVKNNIAIKQGKLGGKKGYLFARIWLPYDELKYQYSNLQKHKFLLPYYEVCRWCRLFFKGKIKKSVKELNTSQEISQEQVDFLSDLMRILEL